MKTKIILPIHNFYSNQHQNTQNQTIPPIKSLNKPMSKQTLNFFKNLNINRINIPQNTPLQESLRIYFNQYKQLYHQNKRLNRQFIQVVEKKNQLAEIYISKMKLNKALGGKIKRKRRYASQIKRQFECPIEDCGKSYGTDASLTQHVKIKHQSFYKSGSYDEFLTKIMRDKMSYID